jgi:hypothetical protein
MSAAAAGTCGITPVPERAPTVSDHLNHLVSVTLLFATDAPPPTLAMDVERAVIAHVPHRLDGATWTGTLADEAALGAADDPPPPAGLSPVDGPAW